MKKSPLTAFIGAALFALSGCTKEQPSGAAQTHTHDEGQAHGQPPETPSIQASVPQGSHGAAVELGTAMIGDWSVRAARDAGAISPGGDAPIDVWLTGGTSKVAAVRFWIGIESAAGSVKARADIENPAQPNHWHTHAEIPNPLPVDARLWVELDIEGVGKKTGSFALNG